MQGLSIRLHLRHLYIHLFVLIISWILPFQRSFADDTQIRTARIKITSQLQTKLKIPLKAQCLRVLDAAFPQIIDPVSRGLRSLNLSMIEYAKTHQVSNQWIDADERLYERFWMYYESEMAKLSDSDRPRLIGQLLRGDFSRVRKLHPLDRNFDPVWFYFSKGRLWENFIDRVRRRLVADFVNEKNLSVDGLYELTQIIVEESFGYQFMDQLKNIYTNKKISIYLRAGAYAKSLIYFRRLQDELNDDLTKISAKEQKYRQMGKGPYPLAVYLRRKLLAVTAMLNWLKEDLPIIDYQFRTDAKRFG
jgi:hypothetical protein